MFTWVLERLGEAGLVKGKTIAIDATTLEANAALRHIVRRDTGESYQEFLTTLAQASGIETPTRADLARLDRKRKKKGSNKDWTSPSDPDAKITKMKDGRTHLAHKAEHAVDLDTGAIVAVTIQGADQGDTATLPETLAEAVEQLDQVTDADGEPVALADEVVADKGCHSRAVVLELSTHGFRTYISEPDRGDQSWIDQEDARDAVYGNRRRIRGDRGKRLLRRRGERVERSFAHTYDTGGMRRTHLRGHHEYPQARAHPRQRLQSRAGHATSHRRRDAAQSTRPAGRAEHRRGQCRLGDDLGADGAMGRHAWGLSPLSNANAVDLVVARPTHNRHLHHGLLGDGNSCYYFAAQVDANGNPSAGWEIGVGRIQHLARR